MAARKNKNLEKIIAKLKPIVEDFGDGRLVELNIEGDSMKGYYIRGSISPSILNGIFARLSYDKKSKKVIVQATNESFLTILEGVCATYKKKFKDSIILKY